jgi:membrane-associated phospholipid phosphatase
MTVGRSTSTSTRRPARSSVTGSSRTAAFGGSRRHLQQGSPGRLACVGLSHVHDDGNLEFRAASGRVGMKLARKAQRERRPLIDWAARAASSRTVRLLGVLVATGVAVRRTRDVRPAVEVAAAVALAHAAGSALRRAFDRARPYQEADDVTPGVAPAPASSSFPSTHAADGAAVAAVLAPHIGLLRYPVLVGSAATGASRVWLGVHHVSDVVAGGALGALAARTVTVRLAPIVADALKTFRTTPPREGAPTHTHPAGG